MKQIKLTLPVYHNTGKKTIFLGMNWYRNAHFFTSNKVKQELEDIIINQIPANVTFDQYQIAYTYYFKSIISDLPNVTALGSKFLNDALKKAGVIKDDNVQYLKHESYSVGSQDKTNPRIEVIIGEYNEPSNTSDNTTK